MEPSPTDAAELIIVVGPTGIGKTSAGIRLARHFGGEIISADSMQIYRHMDIGTAKPTAQEQSQARHHLVDIVDPDESFDAARFADVARRAIARLQERGKVPVIVGGTGFYIKALLHGLYPAPAPDPVLRERLRSELDQEGAVVLHTRLASLDPLAAERIHPNDSYRLLRALETVMGTGRTLSEWQQDHGFPPSPYRFFRIGLEMERPAMYARINARVEQMVQAGLLSEVQGLLDMGYGPELKAMQSLGYRHMTAHLLDGLRWAEAVGTMQRDTRRYAKRQLTWFKRETKTTWIAPGNLVRLLPEVASFLNRSGEC